MPCTFGSALYAATTASTSSSVASPGRSVPKDSIPASAHAFFFERTYVSESLRSPTSTTARPGTLSVLSFIAATFARTSSRTVSAMALPSMIAASRARSGGRTRAVARVPRRRRGAGAESFQPRGVVEIADIACSGCGDRRSRAAAVEKSEEEGPRAPHESLLLFVLNLREHCKSAHTLSSGDPRSRTTPPRRPVDRPRRRSGAARRFVTDGRDGGLRVGRRGRGTFHCATEGR